VVAVRRADLKEAARVVQDFLDAFLAGKHDDAAAYYADLSGEHRTQFEGELADWMKQFQPSRVASLGPARKNQWDPERIEVPFRVEGAQTLTMETRVGRDDPSQKWSFWGTSMR